jgi:hypothetical protein
VAGVVPRLKYLVRTGGVSCFGLRGCGRRGGHGCAVLAVFARVSERMRFGHDGWERGRERVSDYLFVTFSHMS